ncbi:hypothetical protein RRG08_052549 [Elysia crispata]|uniref:Uncharacterized protein n=1 Tax=Elysia crispata TaxID=231223 RepID=A0AAE1DA81_9GAST|nr:hypothetical protein RRG08_052549 [Elysia crispata]
MARRVLDSSHFPCKIDQKSWHRKTTQVTNLHGQFTVPSTKRLDLSVYGGFCINTHLCRSSLPQYEDMDKKDTVITPGVCGLLSTHIRSSPPLTHLSPEPYQSCGQLKTRADALSWNERAPNYSDKRTTSGRRLHD